MKNKSDKIEYIYKSFFKKKTVKIDSREIKKGDIFFSINNGNLFVEKSLQAGAGLVVLDNKKEYKKWEKKYDKKIVLVEDSIQTLQDLAKKYRSELKIPILGITGSNGKTTTKELVKTVLSKKFNVLATSGNLNNHIGVPLTVLSIKPKHNFAVIEMGANHIGEIKILAEIVSPDFGIVTNIGKAHIGEFKNFANIKKTKKELYDEVLKNNGKIFINPQDKILEKASKGFPQKQKINYFKGQILPSQDFLKIQINKKKFETKMVGEYNLNNFLTAFTVGKFLKISEKKIIDSLKKYKPKNNRSEKEITKKNNEIVWDCYNANPNSMSEAIKSFTKNRGKIFILGDMKELGKYSKGEHKKILKLIEKNNLNILVGGEFFKIKNKKDNFVFLKNINEVKKWLKNSKVKNSKILIKGSNSIKLFELKNKNIL